MADTVAMSEADTTHASSVSDASHDSGHGHEPAAEPLGPVDRRGWAIAIGGGAIGVLVTLALFVAGQG